MRRTQHQREIGWDRGSVVIDLRDTPAPALMSTEAADALHNGWHHEPQNGTQNGTQNGGEPEPERGRVQRHRRPNRPLRAQTY